MQDIIRKILTQKEYPSKKKLKKSRSETPEQAITCESHIYEYSSFFYRYKRIIMVSYADECDSRHTILVSIYFINKASSNR